MLSIDHHQCHYIPLLSHINQTNNQPTTTTGIPWKSNENSIDWQRKIKFLKTTTTTTTQFVSNGPKVSLEFSCILLSFLFFSLFYGLLSCFSLCMSISNYKSLYTYIKYLIIFYITFEAFFSNNIVLMPIFFVY